MFSLVRVRRRKRTQVTNRTRVAKTDKSIRVESAPPFIRSNTTVANVNPFLSHQSLIPNSWTSLLIVAISNLIVFSDTSECPLTTHHNTPINMRRKSVPFVFPFQIRAGCTEGLDANGTENPSSRSRVPEYCGSFGEGKGVLGLRLPFMAGWWRCWAET
jgi:hypothetical protein